MKRCFAALIGACVLAGAHAAQNDASAQGDDGQWTMPAKDYASTRYSRLNAINAGNVGKLQVAWTFSTGLVHGHEAAPLVVGDTMYIVTPYPNLLYAIDLKAPGGELKWTYKPHPERAAQGVACCDVVNRGAVYTDGKIIFNTLDDNTVAVDAQTGKEIWKTKLGDINLGETMTMAPLVVKDKVLVGNAGGEMGVRGWLTALDVKTGKQVWRAYSTGPDKDVLIGPDFKPPYPKDAGRDLGVSTWAPDQWKTGGGTVWGWISYDAQTNLIFYGTSNPGPWNPAQRPGDNKWTSTIFARDADTGMAKWAVQYNPHDLHDYDGVNENVLVDLPINGKTEKVLLHPDRNGYLYMMDRATGRILSAPPFEHNTAIRSIDLQSGKPILNEDKTPQPGRLVKDICPSSSGGKDWQPSAWSPDTRLLYVPHNHLCMDVTASETSYIAGTPFVGMELKFYRGPGNYGGAFSAWDPVAGKAAWSIHERYPVWSGALATAGGVVFYGTMDRWFKAVDARSGKELWKFRTGSGVIGQPVTFRGPDGKQYVAVLAGVGGWAGAIVAGGLDPRVPYGAAGFVNATRDLPKETAAGGTLYVFAIPEAQ
ncbi:methanol/ethanol family PQQ-dependent dehydrogenase [Noviherbaspirillum pedocola]|uniref:Methanol/ethanol family PQQ-dependent dehydrogenase n=1 Tax=Noviherbaspirillum pedocola TaxID=2801341 RepID=A0A934W6U4_9BURK|nr:methanol/ethanol family PQQ-dependent dehydrogenase [Noviherbaspirillum pedocola]MBK4736602.1 methanol/ethanol family PQQ-dependent dehydrogenase [Noviherbaspirillum pedocola]